MATLTLKSTEERMHEQRLRRCLSNLELEILHTDHTEFPICSRNDVKPSRRFLNA